MIIREYRAFLHENDEVIDDTVIDENDEKFAMELFIDECGHTDLSANAYVTLEELGLYDTETDKDVEETPENIAKIGRE